MSDPRGPVGRTAISVTGVWLRGDGADAVVLVEVNGAWVEVIREYLGHPDGIWPASHIVESRGIAAVLSEPTQEGER